MSIKVSKDIKATQEELAFANRFTGEDVTYTTSFYNFLANMICSAETMAKYNPGDDTAVIFHPVRVRLK